MNKNKIVMALGLSVSVGLLGCGGEAQAPLEEALPAPTP